MFRPSVSCSPFKIMLTYESGSLNRFNKALSDLVSYTPSFPECKCIATCYPLAPDCPCAMHNHGKHAVFVLIHPINVSNQHIRSI